MDNNPLSNRNELISSNINEPNTTTNYNKKSFQIKLNTQEDIEAEIKRAYEIELRKIKEDKSNELDQIKRRESINENEIATLRKEKDDIVHRLNARIEVLNNYYTDEKAKNNQLLLKIKSLEDSFKVLNNEYLSLNFKYSKTQTDTENMEKSLMEIRKSNNDTKFKFEDLIKINNELKQRLIEYENSAKLHQDDLKNILKRNSNLQKNLEVKKKKIK
jgi:chromosome segregation ATPase